MPSLKQLMNFTVNNIMDAKINSFIENIKARYGVNCGVSEMRTDMLHAELRQACECNTCGNYGLCHTCPPNIGTAEECMERIGGYKIFIAFQKIYALEDSFDFEGMMEGQRDFKVVMKGVAEAARKAFEKPLILGAGGCMICERCAARDNQPCRFPELALSSLEANCIQVSQFAEGCGLKYINGQNTVTYFGGIFLK